MATFFYYDFIAFNLLCIRFPFVLRSYSYSLFKLMNFGVIYNSCVILNESNTINLYVAPKVSSFSTSFLVSSLKKKGCEKGQKIK